MKCKFTISFLVFLFYTIIFSQSLQITGKITDKNGMPVEYAELYLLPSDSLHSVKSDFAEENGSFSLQANSGIYIFQVKQTGDIIYSQKINLFQNIDLGTITIAQSAKEIQAITIEGKKKLIERKVDRLVFNVENSISASGGSSLEALKITPGISIQNEKISMIGKSSMRIMINNRIIELSNEDLTNYLRAIPADNIKSIEVITNPPAKYEAEGNSGLINILLKTENKTEAWNLSVQESYKQASYPGNNGNVNFNYNKNKIKLTSGFSYGTRKYETILKNELYYLKGLQKEVGKEPLDNKYLLGNIGIDYQLNPKVILGGTYSYSHSNAKGSMTTDTDVAGNTSYDFIRTLSSEDNISNLHQVNIHNSTILDTIGKKLTVDFNFLNYKKDNSNFFTRNYYLGSDNVDQKNGNNNGNQKINNYSLLIDMEHPTSWIKINYGLKLSFSKTHNRISLYNFTSEIPQYAENDNFIYKENIQAAYVSGEKKFSNKWEAKAGLRAENAQIKGNSVSLQQTNTKNYHY